MPIIKSAKKRMKTSEKNRQSNMSVRSRISTARGKLNKAIAAEKKADSETLFRAYCSVLDKAVKHRIIKSNSADRRKSRAARKIAVIA